MSERAEQKINVAVELIENTAQSIEAYLVELRGAGNLRVLVAAELDFKLSQIAERLVNLVGSVTDALSAPIDQPIDPPAAPVAPTSDWHGRDEPAEGAD